MPKAKYDFIYKDLKSRIENGEYEFQELLPSENHLVLTYGCSRNTVRRAVAALVTDGYVQTMQGKGVRNIFEPAQQTSFTLGGIESFKESALRNRQTPRTKVLCFTELTADEKISKKTGFPPGSQITFSNSPTFLMVKHWFYTNIIFTIYANRHLMCSISNVNNKVLQLSNNICSLIL